MYSEAGLHNNCVFNDINCMNHFMAKMSIYNNYYC